MAELMLGNLTKAKQYAHKSLNFNKDSIDGKIAFVLIFSELGEFKKSEKLFVSAMLASSNSTFAGRSYVISLLRQKQSK